MKTLKEIIQEKLKIGSKTNIDQYEFHPKNKDELKELVDKLIKERGEEADLNDIDTSKITDMSSLFRSTEFNGDISGWNVSNVKDMNNMFNYSAFNGDISRWNVSNVKNMFRMFIHAKEFNGDISNWDVSNVENMNQMFNYSPLEKNPPKWYKNERIK